MKIRRLQLTNFMTFEEFDVQWSPQINVIFGENSSGKTTLLKAMYSTLKTLGLPQERTTKERLEAAFVDKICGVFRPDDRLVGRLATRKQGNVKSEIRLTLGEKGKNSADLGTIRAAFSAKNTRRVEIARQLEREPQAFEPIFLPPKEMISATEHFQQLYEKYEIDFDETYCDLTKLLDRPLKRGANATRTRRVLNILEKILEGNVVSRAKKFYLKVAGAGEFEMGLVAEGLRKLSTLSYLVSSGSLNKDAVLFWDEPEANLNPRSIRPLVDVMIELANSGVQIFVATHSYFVQQYFNLRAAYPKTGGGQTDVKFFSLYFDRSEDDKKTLQFEEASIVSDLKHNAIMEEFDEIYQRELGTIDDV